MLRSFWKRYVDEGILLYSSTKSSPLTSSYDLIRYVANGEALPFAVVAAFLRLGNKYDIEVLRVDALKRLFHEIPSNLDTLDQRSRALSSWSMIYSEDCTMKEMLNVAREQNLLSALPLARYRCCVVGTAADLSKPSFSDDGIAYMLDQEEARICSAAYVPLLTLQGKTTLSWMTAPSSKYPGCHSILMCMGARRVLAIERFAPIPSMNGLEMWDKKFERSMCKYCIEMAKHEHNEGRRRFWEALPGIFGLPEWEELNEERNESMRYVHIAPKDRDHGR